MSRKFMRWYVEPVAAQQRSFNLAVLGLVDELRENGPRPMWPALSSRSQGWKNV